MESKKRDERTGVFPLADDASFLSKHAPRMLAFKSRGWAPTVL